MSRDRHRSSAGMAKLAAAIDGQVKRRARPPYVNDLGTLEGAGLRLRLDRYGVLLDASDYLVDERFTQGTKNTSSESDDTFDAHTHAITSAGTFWRPLAPGDRVIVQILDGDQDEWTPIITGRLASA